MDNYVAMILQGLGLQSFDSDSDSIDRARVIGESIGTDGWLLEEDISLELYQVNCKRKSVIV